MFSPRRPARAFVSSRVEDFRSECVYPAVPMPIPSTAAAGCPLARPPAAGFGLYLRAGNLHRVIMAETPPPAPQFGAFYQETLSPLRRYLAAVLRDPAEAQDIAHDAYLRTYAAMQEKPVEQPKAFLFTTARRLALNFRMRRARRMQPVENAVLDREAAGTPDAGDTAIANQQRETMEAAIAGLPAGCREVLVLRTREELSHQEIADRLGIARSTVEKHLARALRRLREAVAENPARPDAP